MVFPSPGCQTCRKRKVKCDYTRPRCRKCLTGDRKCTWDSDEQTGLHFRSENAFAMGLRRRPPKTSGNPAVLTNSISSAFTQVSNSSRVQPALSLPLEMHALYYYADSVSMETHILGDPSHDYGFHVLPHWELASPESCLRLALTAYSHAVIGRNRGIEQALSLAQRVYAMTVEKIQRAIARISGDTIYQVILAVMLMGSYESVMYFSRESTSSLPPDAVGSRFWGIICHEKGAAALLIARRERGFAANTELDKAIRKKCLHIIILRGGPILDCLKDGRSWGEDGHELQLDSLMIRVLSLRHKSMCFLRDMDAVEPETVDKARSIAMEAYTLDYDLASWPLGLPQNWGFQISRTHSQPSSNVADASVGIPTHNYPSIGHATIWNQYRALRLITNAIQKRALVALQPLLEGSFLDTNIKRCQDNINDLAVDLCSGIKFLIAYRTPNRGSEATALHHMPYPSVATLLAWPLTVAVSVDAVQPPEKTWLKSALKVVSLSLGHSLLESVADQGEFKF